MLPQHKQRFNSQPTMAPWIPQGPAPALLPAHGVIPGQLGEPRARAGQGAGPAAPMGPGAEAVRAGAAAPSAAASLRPRSPTCPRRPPLAGLVSPGGPMRFDLFLFFFFFSSGLFTKLEQSFSCDFSSPDKSISALFHTPAPGRSHPDSNGESGSVPVPEPRTGGGPGGGHVPRRCWLTGCVFWG